MPALYIKLALYKKLKLLPLYTKTFAYSHKLTQKLQKTQKLS